MRDVRVDPVRWDRRVPREAEFTWPGYHIEHQFRVIERYEGCPVLQFRATQRGVHMWQDYGDIGYTVVTPQFIAFLHDLFSNPYETDSQPQADGEPTEQDVIGLQRAYTDEREWAASLRFTPAAEGSC